MEYLIGSVVTLVVVLTLSAVYSRYRPELSRGITVRYSQSHVHELVAPFYPTNSELAKPLQSQAKRNYDKRHIRILSWEGKAYWIKDNIFYVADIVNGDVDDATATQVDTMAMDKVQLDKMMFIVGKLTEGLSDDYWNSRKS